MSLYHIDVADKCIKKIGQMQETKEYLQKNAKKMAKKELKRRKKWKKLQRERRDAPEVEKKLHEKSIVNVAKEEQIIILLNFSFWTRTSIISDRKNWWTKRYFNRRRLVYLYGPTKCHIELNHYLTMIDCVCLIRAVSCSDDRHTIWLKKMCALKSYRRPLYARKNDCGCKGSRQKWFNLGLVLAWKLDDRFNGCAGFFLLVMRFERFSA